MVYHLHRSLFSEFGACRRDNFPRLDRPLLADVLFTHERLQVFIRERRFGKRGTRQVSSLIVCLGDAFACSFVSAERYTLNLWLANRPGPSPLVFVLRLDLLVVGAATSSRVIYEVVHRQLSNADSPIAPPPCLGLR